MKMNRSQKTFLTFLVFNGETDNGGVYQFIFNRPLYIFAVSEMWYEIGMLDVAKDYDAVLEELIGESEAIGALKQKFNDSSKSFDEQWEAFSSGYDILKSTEKIEHYYFDKEFKKRCHKKLSDYIESHINNFIR